jgi:hypothetical protein
MMGVQLCLVLPGPEESAGLIEGDVLDLESGDVDYGEMIDDGNGMGGGDDDVAGGDSGAGLVDG